jgi:hypothetical protein
MIVIVARRVVDDLEGLTAAEATGGQGHRPGDPLPPGKEWTTVRYAFAVSGHRAVVTIEATDTDLGPGSAAADDLVRTITVSPADGTPVGVESAAVG